jgi:hypothetical protein
LNHSGRSLELQVGERSGDFVDKARETSGSVAAHLRFAAVAVIVSHPKIGFSGGCLDKEHSVRPDTSMAVTQMGELSRRKFVGARSIIDEHEIVPGAVHFRKPKHHHLLTYAQLRSAFNGQRFTFNVRRSAFNVWRFGGRRAVH